MVLWRTHASPRVWRQVLACLAVAGAGGASLGTSGCEGGYTTTLTTHVTLDTTAATTTAHFRVVTELDLDKLDASARVSAGDGSVELTAPSPLLAPRDEEPPVPNGTDAVTFTVSPSTPQAATICRGFCKKTFDIDLTATSGKGPVEVELTLEAVTIDYGCDGRDQYSLVLERVDE